MINKHNILNPVLYSMANGYRKQLVKYKAMFKLAEKQKECVENDELDKLAEVVEARQVLIKELEEMNNKIKPLRNDIMNTLGLKDFSSAAVLQAIPTKAAQDLADALKDLGQVLYDIKEMDKLNEKLLREKLTIVKRELIGVQNKKQVVKAYNKAKAFQKEDQKKS